MAVRILVGTCVLCFSAFQMANAESLVEQVVDTRLVLSFKTDPVELQKLVPGPWTITAAAAGPAKDANFSLIFYERMMQQDGAGASMGQPYRFVVFVAGATPKEASAPATVVSRIYASDPRAVPGPYKNSQSARVEHRITTDSAEQMGTVEESWEVGAPQDHAISLTLKYERSARTRQKSEGKVYSSVDPGFYRIYRWDLLAEAVKSAALGVDRVKNQNFNANISDYARLFATAELVAITAQPMYVRNVWLP